MITALNLFVKADGTEYDTQIQNATLLRQSRIRVNFGQFVARFAESAPTRNRGEPFETQGKLVINVSNLTVPERLLALVPFGLILPKVIERMRRSRRLRRLRSNDL